MTNMNLDLTIAVWVSDPALKQALHDLLSSRSALLRIMTSRDQLLGLLSDEVRAPDVVLTNDCSQPLQDAARQTAIVWVGPLDGDLPDDGVRLRELGPDSHQLETAIIDAINLLRTSQILHGGSLVSAEEPETALELGFDVHFQPQWQIDGHRIRAAEALLRWHGLEVDALQPEAYIAAAEAQGQIARVGDWIISRALRHAGSWRPVWPQDMRLAFNLTLGQVQAANCTEILLDSLARHHLECAHVELELNARDLPQLAGNCTTELYYLHDLGFRITLDRVGQGPLDAELLQELPLSGIKIDRSLVARITSDDSSRRLVQQLIALADQLSFHCTAVGVETEAQRSLLQSAGCEAMQGFLLADAMPAEQFQALLQAGLDRHRDA